MIWITQNVQLRECIVSVIITVVIINIIIINEIIRFFDRLVGVFCNKLILVVNLRIIIYHVL